MTIATPSIPMLVRESIPLRTVEASSPTTNPADAEARHLAAAIGRGDESAFHRLYEQYHRRLLRFAFAVGRGDETAAQDAVQSAFIAAAKNLRRVESERHLWNWLAQVVRQHLGKLSRKSKMDATAGAPELSKHASVAEV
ncbi:MAG TPA: sigma-70 family RNA polymerase sigma factor, partial [Desulfuromonadaceae bacterium]|nr:sigma-70 family RNA polymerase sigma factor [Desulfuromonadaceae bacterium]